MKTYLKQYRPFFVFLTKFFSVYVVLTLVYQYYLTQFDNSILYQVDGFTQFVANQVQKTVIFFNYESSLMLHDNQASVKLSVNGVYVARIVEGCNALSVIILFVAFVVAFSGKLKQTVLFIIAGSLLIHFLNILRIALLGIALLHYPKQEHLLHGVVFPLIIYGVVFGLWVVWVNKFSKYATEKLK